MRKSAAELRIEELSAALLQKEREIAALVQSHADEKADAAKAAADAEQAAQRAKLVEAARKKAWTLHRFNTFADEHPDQHPPLNSIFSDPPADGSWPEGDGPENWNLPAATDAAAAEVSKQAVADTALGRMLSEMEQNRDRLAKA